MWVNIICNKLSKYYYRKLQKYYSPQFSTYCLRKEIKFSNLSENQFKTFVPEKTTTCPSLIEENQNFQENP